MKNIMSYFEKKIHNTLGFDSWRFFDLTWLNLNGFPQKDIIELSMENSKYALTSSLLSKLLQSFHNVKFEDKEDLFKEIKKSIFDQDIVIQINSIKHEIKKSPLDYLPGFYCHHKYFVFDCPFNAERYSGELIVSICPILKDPNYLDWILLDIQKNPILSLDLADHLHMKLLSIGQPFVLSLHLSRNKGLSYQGIRWSEYPFIDPKNLVSFSCLE